jgi:hypothetical protein
MLSLKSSDQGLHNSDENGPRYPIMMRERGRGTVQGLGLGLGLQIFSRPLDDAVWRHMDSLTEVCGVCKWGRGQVMAWLPIIASAGDQSSAAEGSRKLIGEYEHCSRCMLVHNVRSPSRQYVYFQRSGQPSSCLWLHCGQQIIATIKASWETLAYFRSVCQIKLPAAAHTSYLSAFMLFTSSDLSDELFYLSTFG